MPYIVNGCGTWYHGKRNIRVRRDVCGACGAATDLSSYDTTLYIVFVMIPILPLGSRKILDACPACSRHRVMPLKRYEKARVESAAAAMRICQEDPASSVKAADALRNAIAFQDEETFLGLTALIEPHHGEHADVQALLGEGYDFFHQPAAAEEAFRKAYSLSRTDGHRDRLAAHILRHGSLADARPLMDKHLNSPTTDSLGMLGLYAEAQRAVGDHDGALTTLETMLGLDPKLKKDPWHKAAVKTSTASRSSGVPIRSPVVHPQSPQAPVERAWTARLARMSGFAAIPIAIAAYAAVCFYMGNHHKVHVVNGLRIPYKVQLGNETVMLPPMSRVIAHVPEGNVMVKSLTPGLDLPAQTARVHTTFWARPVSRDSTVINPDQQALLVWEEHPYGTTSANPAPPELRAGDVVYVFNNINFLFTAFPPSISTKGGGMLQRRVDLAHLGSVVEESEAIGGWLPDAARNEWIRRAITYEPENPDCSVLAISFLEPAESMPTLKPLAAHRPILVEVHRAIQTITEQEHPDNNLAAEYRALIAEEPSDAARHYLLGRVVADPAEADACFRKAIELKPDFAHAHGARAYALMSLGKFEEALAEAEVAERDGSGSVLFQSRTDDACHALGQFDRILSRQVYNNHAGQTLWRAALGKVYFLCRAAKPGEARGFVAQFVKPGSSDAGRDLLLGMIAYDEGNLEEFAKEMEATGSPPHQFQGAVAAGKLADAERLAPQSGNAAESHLALYLAATAAGDAALARRQLEVAAVAMRSVGLQERIAAEWIAGASSGKPAPKEADVLGAVMQVSLKRLVLASLGRAYPEKSGAFFELAKRLNYDRRFPYHLVRDAIDPK